MTYACRAENCTMVFEREDAQLQHEDLDHGIVTFADGSVEPIFAWTIISKILNEYDTIIRANDTPGGWNTIKAVHEDDTGEVFYEVWETAEGMGIHPQVYGLEFENLLREAVRFYRKTLALDPRCDQPHDQVVVPE